MSYDEGRPAFFSEESYFDSAQAVWIDPEAEKIPFGAEAVQVSYEGIDEEIAERAERDRNGSRRKPRPLPAELDRSREHTWREQDVVVLGAAKPQPPEIGGVFYPGRRHDVSGEAEAGKSWLALAVGADEMRQRRGVVWIDADDTGGVVSADVEQLESKLGELQGQRAELESALTNEDIARKVDEYLETARAQAAGSSRLVLGGQAAGEHLAQVLFEDRLDDEKLAGRLVARLERQGFGKLSDRQKDGKRKKLDETIAATVAALRDARKAEALAAVEAEFATAGETA